MPTRPPALRPFLLDVIATIACLGLLSATGVLAQESPADREKPVNIAKADDRLKPVATFDQQVTGVAVSETGRIFVNFPRWTEDVPISVAEVQRDGSLKPYPDELWNSWRTDRKDALRATTHFVAVQSVVADGRGSLWVVDPAAPNAEKTVKGGPKIVQIDLVSNTVKRAYLIPPDVAGPTSYLNDIRIAPDGKYAYVTDSGMPGGLVVLEIGSGKSWRALSDAPQTQADPAVTVTTDGRPLRRPDGFQPMANARGIALSTDGAFLYWQALNGKTLYRIETSVLKNPAPHGIEERIQKVTETEPADGLWMDRSGRLYLGSLADNAVKVLEPDGKRHTVVADPRLRWPGTFAEGPDGTLYVTASRIQDSPWFHPAGWQGNGFTLFSFRPDAASESK